MRANCSSPPQITGSHSLGRINSGAVGPEATEDLLPQFHHPTIAFREVVGEGHTQIGEKAQYILFADTQAQQQIMIDPPRQAASFAFADGAKQRAVPDGTPA